MGGGHTKKFVQKRGEKDRKRDIWIKILNEREKENKSSEVKGKDLKIERQREWYINAEREIWGRETKREKLRKIEI